MTLLFQLYFSDLYSESNCDSFDAENKRLVEEAYNDICDSVKNCNGTLPGGSITEHEFECIIKTLKRRKACGHDKIQYEHIIYGGIIATKCLVKLFNMMVYNGRIPKDWKLGLLVPLYKGNGKVKTSPDSYRPISLLLCLLKLFEQVVKTV